MFENDAVVARHKLREQLSLVRDAQAFRGREQRYLDGQAAEFAVLQRRESGIAKRRCHVIEHLRPLRPFGMARRRGVFLKA